MDGICLDDPRILRSIERAEKLEHERQHRAFVAETQKLTPWINHITHAVDKHWQEIPIDHKRQLVDIRQRLDDLFEQIERMNEPKSFFDKFKLGIDSLFSSSYQLVPFFLANVRFFEAMNRAMTRDDAWRNQIETAFRENPEKVAALARARERAKQGSLSREYTSKDFRSSSSG